MSQSSDFIKQVKQKLSTKIPGSRFESQEDSSDQQQQSTQDSCNDQRLTSLNGMMYQKPFSKSNAAFNCQTPDSMLSTGSASIYSNLIARSNSLFVLPEKLKIVKPIEGSQTLQHWQHLARPNLGCLFESRPGVSVVAMKSDSSTESLNNIDLLNAKLVSKNKQKKYGDYEDNDDDGYQDEEEEVEEEEDEIEADDEDFNYFFQNKSQMMDDDYADGDGEDDVEMMHYFDRKQRVLSPSKVELLTRLLENEEEKNQINYRHNNNENNLDNNSNDSNNIDQDSNNDNFFTSFFRSISTRYFKSSDNIQENLIQSNNNDNDVNNNNNNKNKNKNTRNEFDDPDTPPSSPINLPNSDSNDNNNNNNVLYEVFESAKLKCKSYFYRGKFAPTPPGTPTAGIELENYLNSLKNNEQNNYSTTTTTSQKGFFDQIIDKLNVFSSFNNINNSKTISNEPLCSMDSQTDNNISYHNDDNDYDSDKEIERIFASNNHISTEQSSKEIKCSTPPPSPTIAKNFSPPLPLEEDEEEYNEEVLKKSAFVKLSTLNPYINKSIDLSTLLGSLTTLKRNNKLYYNPYKQN